MNKILLTSICSLTVSVPSGFLIYYLSGPSSAKQYSLSELSIIDNNNQYLIGKITSDINNNVATLTNPLKFTCEIASNQACYVKVFNREELIKQDTLDLNTIQNLFVDAKQEQLTKGTYVQVNFNNKHGVEKTTKTETITIDNTDATFTVEWENNKNKDFTINQKEFVTQTITQTQEAYDVDNSRYFLIKISDDEDSVFHPNAWLFPRNKENKKEFSWRIIGDYQIKDQQQAELYEIENQRKVAEQGTKLDKTYFDTQNKFIQTIDALKTQKNKWVKMVIKDQTVNYKIDLMELRKNGYLVLKAYISECHEITQ